VEFDVAINSCKNRVIFAHANAHAWPHLSPTLAHDDVARNDDFATNEPPAFLCAIGFSP
jgi:hypothetical protein